MRCGDAYANTNGYLYANFDAYSDIYAYCYGNATLHLQLQPQLRQRLQLPLQQHLLRLHQVSAHLRRVIGKIIPMPGQ